MYKIYEVLDLPSHTLLVICPLHWSDILTQPTMSRASHLIRLWVYHRAREASFEERASDFIDYTHLGWLGQLYDHKESNSNARDNTGTSDT